MKHPNSILLAAAASAALVTAGPALANDAANLPAPSTQGNVTYLTGGIGQDEAQAMRNEAAHYPLSLEFVEHAQPNDVYLANIDVRIRDANGNTELTTRSDGPFLLAELPPGRYEVTVNDNGRVKTRDATVAANKPQHIVFEW